MQEYDATEIAYRNGYNKAVEVMYANLKKKAVSLRKNDGYCERFVSLEDIKVVAEELQK